MEFESNFGIISRENYIKRTIQIASGKHKPDKDEPKKWFEDLIYPARLENKGKEGFWVSFLDFEKVASGANREEAVENAKKCLARIISSLNKAKGIPTPSKVVGSNYIMVRAPISTIVHFNVKD